MLLQVAVYISPLLAIPSVVSVVAVALSFRVAADSAVCIVVAVVAAAPAAAAAGVAGVGVVLGDPFPAPSLEAAPPFIVACCPFGWGMSCGNGALMAFRPLSTTFQAPSGYFVVDPCTAGVATTAAAFAAGRGGYFRFRPGHSLAMFPDAPDDQQHGLLL